MRYLRIGLEFEKSIGESDALLPRLGLDYTLSARGLDILRPLLSKFKPLKPIADDNDRIWCISEEVSTSTGLSPWILEISNLISASFSDSFALWSAKYLFLIYVNLDETLSFSSSSLSSNFSGLFTDWGEPVFWLSLESLNLISSLLFRRSWMPLTILSSDFPLLVTFSGRALLIFWTPTK